MPAQAYSSPRFDDRLGPGRDLWEDVLVLAEPGTPFRPDRDLVVGYEAFDLGILHDVETLVEIVLTPRAAVRDEQRRRVRDPRLGEYLDHVLAERCNRQAVLVTGIAVHRNGQ